MVSRILQADGRGATMIFTRTKRTAQKVADELSERGFKVGAVHGDPRPDRPRKVAQGVFEPAASTSSSPRTSPHAVSTSTTSPTSSTTRSRTTEQAYVHRIGRTGRQERQVSPSLWSTGTNWNAGR